MNGQEDLLKGKVLLLTGAAGAIGKETAVRFLDTGASVLLLDSNEEELAATHKELESFGARVASAGYDAASQESNRQAVATALDVFGRIDYVVPGAGIYPEGSFAQVSAMQWRSLMDINLNAVFYLVNAALPHLGEGSSVVLVGSIAGQRGSRNHAPYAAGKAALGGLARSLAAETGAVGIRVNVVAPGVLDSPMTKQLRTNGDTELIEKTPLGRLGRPDEISSVIHFLCTPGSSFITGETINVNGGMHMA